MQAKKTKAKAKPAPKISAKKATSKKKSIKAKVDDVLVKVSPQVQKTVDQLIATLQNTREARMGDLKWLAGQILLRSKEISAQIKSVGKKSKAAKPVKRTSVKK